MALAIAIHLLAALVWVGGMFFAYLIARPILAELDVKTRVITWQSGFARFFRYVWLSIAALLVTGYWMIFSVFGGMANVGKHVHLMQGTGIIMMLIFAHVYFSPYKRLKKFVASNDFEQASQQICSIRKFVAINLVLGLLTAVIGSAGRYF